MTIAEQGTQELAEASKISEFVPIVQNGSVFEHDAILDAYHPEGRVRGVLHKLGTIAVSETVLGVAKRTARLAAVGVVGTAIGLSWFGVPIPGPEKGTAQPTLDGHFTIESSRHGGSEESAVSFPSKLPLGIGAKITFDNLPVKITKQGIVPDKISSAEAAGLLSFYTDYPRIVAEGKDTALTYGMFYGLTAICGVLGAEIAYSELKKKGKLENISVGKIGRTALVAGLVYGSVSPAPFVETGTPTGMSINAEYSAVPANVTFSGGFGNFIEQRHAYLERMKKREAAALSHMPTQFKSKDVVVLQAIEGIGCDSVVNGLAAASARIEHPDLILDVGDRALGGTQFDTYCSKDSAMALKGQDILRVEGNHDPLDEFRAKWVTYMTRNIVKKSGVNISGYPDPYRTEIFTQKLKKTGKETRAEAALSSAALAAKAQRINPNLPSIFMSNQPSLGKYVYRDGLATLVLAGGTTSDFQVKETILGKSIRIFLPRANGVKLNDKNPENRLGSLQNTFPHAGGETFIGLDMRTGSVYIQPVIFEATTVKLGKFATISNAFPIQK